MLIYEDVLPAASGYPSALGLWIVLWPFVKGGIDSRAVPVQATGHKTFDLVDLLRRGRRQLLLRSRGR